MSTRTMQKTSGGDAAEALLLEMEQYAGPLRHDENPDNPHIDQPHEDTTHNDLSHQDGP